MLALTEVVGEKGYAATSVADVIGRAGVSRQTFYEQFASKLDCFLAAFDTAGEILLAEVVPVLGDGGDAPLARFDRLLTRYLEVLAASAGPARVLLVECHAAGPEAIRRRAALQERITAVLADVLGVGDERGRFACTVLVAAVGSLVTEPLVSGDTAALAALRQPILDLVAAALACR
ncbi:TetR/AcrR family transcriptional regulator [Iamia sp. SCSIO 61187]|nr:TetR/AcrR family transcriptional regulator [Iamia sp. SCSIO 61187]